MRDKCPKCGARVASCEHNFVVYECSNHGEGIDVTVPCLRNQVNNAKDETERLQSTIATYTKGQRPGKDAIMITAKFRCTRVTESWSEPDYQAKEIVLEAITTSDPNDPNKAWSDATPSGKMEMIITNREAFDQFSVGAEYYITLTRQDEAPKDGSPV